MIGGASSEMHAAFARGNRSPCKRPVDRVCPVLRRRGSPTRFFLDRNDAKTILGEKPDGIRPRRIEIEIARENQWAIYVLALTIREDLLQLKETQPVFSTALEMDVINQRRLAGKIDLRDEGDATSVSFLEWPAFGNEPSWPPEFRLFTKPNEAGSADRPPRQGRLAFKGATSARTLGKFLELKAEDVGQLQAPGDLFSDVPMAGSVRIDIHFLEDYDVRSRGGKKLGDCAQFESLVDVPVDDDDGFLPSPAPLPQRQE